MWGGGLLQNIGPSCITRLDLCCVLKRQQQRRFVNIFSFTYITERERERESYGKWEVVGLFSLLEYLEREAVQFLVIVLRQIFEEALDIFNPLKVICYDRKCKQRKKENEYNLFVCLFVW